MATSVHPHPMTMQAPVHVDALPQLEPPWISVVVIVTALMYASNLTEFTVNLGTAGVSPVSHAAFFLTYGLFGLLLLRNSGLMRFPIIAPLLTITILLAPLSVVWSTAPNETLFRSASVVGSSLFGIYLGWRFTLGRMVFLLAVALTIAAGLSVIAVFVIPSIGIDQSAAHAGIWRGIHFHKNGLGATCAVGCLIIGYAIADSRGNARLFFMGGLLLTLLLLVGARSTTSVFATLIAAAMGLWIGRLQKRPGPIPVLSLIVMFAIMLGLVEIIGKASLENVLGSIGKSETFSGRMEIWEVIWQDHIQDRFWLGYGYGAFWLPDSPQVLAITNALYFTPHYSHNGIVEALVNGGALLVILALMLLISLYVKSTMLMTRWRDLSVSSFPFVFCSYFTLVNITESTIMSQNSIIWSIFIALNVFLAKWLRVRVQ
ncbi:MAG: O-antigen ligase family protein [Geminicoccaceae bacterium]